MPSATLHLTHAELLARDPAVKEPLRSAMQREMTCTRLGAVFLDLPFYTNIVTMMLGYWLEMPAETCPFAQVMHRYHPDLFTWHFLKEARRDHLLPQEQRLAVLGGYLAHVALDLEIHPLVNWCARRETILHGGHESHHHRLTEKYHSLFFHRELQGSDVLGSMRMFTEKTLIVQHAPLVRLNVGVPVFHWSTDLLSGFYYKSAPSMRQFAAWVRSFRHFGFMVSMPLAKTNSNSKGTEANRLRYYENESFSFSEHWQRAYLRSVSLLNLACDMLTAEDLSDACRDAFLRQARIGDLAEPPGIGLPPLPELAPAELAPAEAAIAATGS